MFRKHSRIIAGIALGFFTWTSGGVFTVANAAVDAVKKGKAREEQKQFQKKSEGPEERFGKATEALRVALADPKADLDKKKEQLKLQKAAIDAADPEIRKEFAATEKRLKDAKLPAEILLRHYKFVKHYDDNLAELKGNIGRVEKAKDKKVAEAEIEKTRLHLEKVKAPSRHQALDPNNLPHRQPKFKKREPRMKKEEFERDFAKGKSAWRDQKRVMVASTGSLAGLLVSSTVTLPTAADLAETIDVQLTPEIRAKALELGNNPVKIYEWVRNNIEFVPTWGSIQGANMTLQTKQGNAFDTSSLLVALLRASGIHARYVMGTIELPIDKVMNWAGGFTDPQAALDFIASGGVPVTGLRSGGNIVSARMEHVWVKAFIDYVPSMGAVHKKGNTWIPLDTSFKKYTYTEGIDFQTLVPFDGQSFADQLKASSIINEQEGYVTNVNSALVGTTLSDYNTRLQSYVTQNLPNATASDILGKKEIIVKEQPILPASLPYKVIVAGTETTEVPSELRHTIDINLIDTGSLSTVISYSATLPQLAGKRITVSFDPATPADKTTIDNYAAQYATSIPAYLIQLIPVLRIENTIIATGPPAGMGATQNLSITISSPSDSNTVTHDLLAGDYTSIGLNPSKIGLNLFQNRVDKNDFSEPVGEMLHQTALSYWAEADAFNDVIAKTLRVRNLRHPSELTATAKISVSSVFGVPTSATYNSRNLDVKLDNQSVMGKTIDRAKEFSYMQQSGMNSSFLEGAVLDQVFGNNIGDSISALSAIKLANDQGIPIYSINASNVTSVVPKLQLADEIKAEVANSVNAGLVVQIPKSDITQLGWTGVGYIISNPLDGTAAYRISGGLNGGANGTGTNTVMATPQVPISGPIGFILAGLSSSGEIALNVEGGVLTGVSISPEVVAALLAGAEVMGLILLILLVFIIAFSITKWLMDKLPPRFEKYRKYTTDFWAKEAWLTREISTSIIDWFQGDLWAPGIYITDLTIEPINEDIRTQIATILRIPRGGPPDPTRVTAYVDILIDRNRVGLISLPFIYPHQYLYPHIPLWENGVTIKFTGIGPFLTP